MKAEVRARTRAVYWFPYLHEPAGASAARGKSIIPDACQPLIPCTPEREEHFVPRILQRTRWIRHLSVRLYSRCRRYLSRSGGYVEKEVSAYLMMRIVENREEVIFSDSGARKWQSVMVSYCLRAVELCESRCDLLDSRFLVDESAGVLKIPIRRKRIYMLEKEEVSCRQHRGTMEFVEQEESAEKRHKAREKKRGRSYQDSYFDARAHARARVCVCVCGCE